MSAFQIFEVAWTNPYTEPPNGKRVLGRIVYAPGADPFLPWKLGCGYGPRFVERVGKVKKIPRRWSPGRKGAMRRRNLQTRVQRAAPLFAPEIVAEQLAARPDYFSGADFTGTVLPEIPRQSRKERA